MEAAKSTGLHAKVNKGRESLGSDLALDIDLDRNEQLTAWRGEKDDLQESEYRASEQQLLREGKLGDSRWDVRLSNVEFGSYDGGSACVVVLNISFNAKSQRWFRFRNARIEVEFGSVAEGDKTKEQSASSLLIRKWYPDLIRGHVQNVAQKYGFSISIPIPVPGAAGQTSANWNLTDPKEGVHLIHGSLIGNSQRVLRWQIQENPVTRGGIYEEPRLAIVISNTANLPFNITVFARATTFGGLPVRSKGGSRISISPPNKEHPGIVSQPASQNITNSNDEPSLASEQISAVKDLRNLDLEQLTGMRAALLGQQAPGAPGQSFG